MENEQQLSDLFEHGVWYHCLSHDGLESKGAYDLRDYLNYYGFEQSYAGKTVIDVGCSDGFFSQLFKQRGASRVVGVDSNKYEGSVAISPSNSRAESYAKKYLSYREDYERFRALYERYGLNRANKYLMMSKLKGVNLEFENGSIYDLSPYGQFDIAFCGDLLEHLRDPISAIEQLYFCSKEKAIISCSSALEPNFITRLWKRPLLAYRGHEGGGSFYEISEAALLAMCKAAGFEKTEVVGRFYMHNKRSGAKIYHVVVHAYKDARLACRAQ